MLALFVGFLGLCLWRTYLVFVRSTGITEAMALGLMGGVISWCFHQMANLDAIFANNTLWILFGLMAALELMVKKQQAQQSLETPQ